MLHTKIIDASKEKIDILKAEKFLSSSNFGAIIYFVGTVRDLNENKKVTGITYDSRDTMVIKSFKEIYKESETKLKIKDKAVFIEHVKGYVDVKEKSIIIGAACKHRDEAYNLSRFIIEEVKKKSPIWKKRTLR
jgi:Molybdopterin converting factor, large subunit